MLGIWKNYPLFFLFFRICVPDALKNVILGVQNRNLEMSVNRPLVFY